MLLGRVTIACIVLAGGPPARAADRLAIAGMGEGAPSFGSSAGEAGDPAMAVVYAGADPGPRDCTCDGLALAAIRGVAQSAPGSRTGALFRSLLVPGYGQFYNAQPVKGGFLLGAEIALLSTALAFHLAGDSVLTAYSRDARAQVSTDPTGRVQQLYDSAQARYRVRDALLLSATGIWVLNLADAYLSGGKGLPALDAGRTSPASDRGLAPLAAIRPGHAILGVQGRF